MVRLRVGPGDFPRSGRDDPPPERERAEGLRVDQPVYRPEITGIPGAEREGLPAEAPGRLPVAVGQMAAGAGNLRLHQPGGVPVVCRQAERPGGDRRRLLQDRLRRAYPDGRPVV